MFPRLTFSHNLNISRATSIVPSYFLHVRHQETLCSQFRLSFGNCSSMPSRVRQPCYLYHIMCIYIYIYIYICIHMYTYPDLSPESPWFWLNLSFHVFPFLGTWKKNLLSDGQVHEIIPSLVGSCCLSLRKPLETSHFEALQALNTSIFHVQIY